MNLVRLGHYHTPTGDDDTGYCQTALVVGVHPEGQLTSPSQLVNLRVWDFDGDDQRRLNVPVTGPQADHASFHLAGDCPWHR